jgi:hypothetical protein
MRRKSEQPGRTGEKMKKKLMVTAATLALMVAMASPSFASAVGGDVDIDVMRAPQFQFAAALQTQHGDATSSATSTAGRFASAADASADASIDQSLTIDQWQWTGGF